MDGCLSQPGGEVRLASRISNEQLVYTGGWVIDEAALFEDSQTVLTMTAVPKVVGVDPGDLDGDGLSDVVEQSLSGPRALRGARLVSGSGEASAESGALSSGEVAGVERLLRKRPSRAKYGDIRLKHVPLDAPILHLANAERASADVKFKAGAELSKSVN